MKTSIIIPTYNNEEYTIRCMESISLHTKDYIILWVDDASSKESVEAVQRYLDEKSIPYELIIKDENSGFAKSVNLGLARALELESEYIVIQNNDTEVYENWLDRMIDVVNRDPRIGAVGPVTSPCESWQSIDNLRNEFDQFANLPKYVDNPAEYAQQIADLYKNQHLIVYKRIAFFLVLFKADIIRGSVLFPKSTASVSEKMMTICSGYGKRAISVHWQRMSLSSITTTPRSKTNFLIKRYRK